MDLNPHILAFDAGTSALKAVLYHQDGRLLAAAQKRYGYQTPQSGWAEADPNAWWEALIAAVQELSAGWNLQQIKIIGITGQMHTPVLLDAQGELLQPAILWLDRRAVSETAELAETLNLPPYQLNSTYTLPKLLWLSRHQPAMMAQVSALLWPKDFLRYRLTGRLLTDSTEAAGAALYDLEKMDWAVERLAPTYLDPAILPPIRSFADDAGPLLPAEAARLGLAPRTKIIIGAGDIIALLAGAPPKPGRLTCSLGSSAMIAAPLADGQTFEDNHQRLYNNFVAPYRLINGVMSTSGAALTWACETLYGQEASFKELMEMVQKTEPGAGGLLFLPFLAGERSPYWNDALRGSFYGLTLAHTRIQMIRAVMEGVAYNLHHLITVCSELGVPIDEIALSGGGAAVPGWPQIFANICRIPVTIYVTQETVTRPIYAYCTHALDKTISVAEALQRTFIDKPNIFQPQPEIAAAYEPLYKTFRILADFAASTSLPAYEV